MTKFTTLYKMCALILCCATTLSAASRSYSSQQQMSSHHQPSVKMMDGINIGIGSANTYDRADTRGAVYDGKANPSLFNNLIPTESKGNIFSPVVELGYTYEFEHFLLGLLVDYKYDRYREVSDIVGSSQVVAQIVTKFNNQLSPMIFFGIKGSSQDAIYLKAGYTGLWTSQELQPLNAGITITGLAHQQSVSSSSYKNGVVLGAGYRHYFPMNVFVEIDGMYGFYFNNGKGENLNANLNAGLGDRVSVDSLHNIYSYAGMVFKVNYLFKISDISNWFN